MLEFSKIYRVLPQVAVISQIELNNENLYSFISQDEIKQLEEGLYDYNISDDILNTILSRNVGSKINR